MGKYKVKDILNWLESWAPTSTAEEWDNVGLLAGSCDAEVTTVVTALDISSDVINQAAKAGAELIISHHPVIFRPLKRLWQDNPAYLIARHGMSAIAMHTNMDKAAGGVNDILAKRLGLREVVVLNDGLVRQGILETEMEPEEFAKMVKERLGVPDGGIMWAKGRRKVRTAALCSGAGGDYVNDLPASCDAYITGELRHHEWPLSPEATIVAAGHFYTEYIIAAEMAERLSQEFKGLTVIPANEQCPYSFL